MDNIFEKLPISPLMQDILGAFLILLGTFVAAIIVRRLFVSLLGRLTRSTKTDLDDRMLLVTRKWIYRLVYILGIAVLLNYVEARLKDSLGEQLFRALDGINFAVGVAFATILIVSIIGTFLKWYHDTVAAKTETTFDDEFVPLIDRAAKIVIYSLGLLIILDHFDVDINGLVAVLGVGSLAVALAAQDTLANMIGGFVIMIDRPFRLGDRLQLPDGTKSIVHEIGIRSTKFRTFDNTLIIVPNAELTKSTIHNLTYPVPETRVRVDVGVGYDSDLEKVREILLGVADGHNKVLETPVPYFAFLSFGDSSLDVALFCRVRKPEDQWKTGCEIREGILRRFREKGIEIPFPQRVVTNIPVAPTKRT